MLNIIKSIFACLMVIIFFSCEETKTIDKNRTPAPQTDQTTKDQKTTTDQNQTEQKPAPSTPKVSISNFKVESSSEMQLVLSWDYSPASYTNGFTIIPNPASIFPTNTFSTVNLSSEVTNSGTYNGKGKHVIPINSSALGDKTLYEYVQGTTYTISIQVSSSNYTGSSSISLDFSALASFQNLPCNQLNSVLTNMQANKSSNWLTPVVISGQTYTLYQVNQRWQQCFSTYYPPCVQYPTYCQDSTTPLYPNTPCSTCNTYYNPSDNGVNGVGTVEIGADLSNLPTWGKVLIGGLVLYTTYKIYQKFTLLEAETSSELSLFCSQNDNRKPMNHISFQNQIGDKMYDLTISPYVENEKINQELAVLMQHQNNPEAIKEHLTEFKKLYCLPTEDSETNALKKILSSETLSISSFTNDPKASFFGEPIFKFSLSNPYSNQFKSLTLDQVLEKFIDTKTGKKKFLRFISGGTVPSTSKINIYPEDSHPYQKVDIFLGVEKVDSASTVFKPSLLINCLNYICDKTSEVK